jgi:superoxide reductase
MAKINEVYRCDVCGNMVIVVHSGQGGLVCCGQPMKLMEDNTVDAAQEKHVPVVEKVDNGYKVSVGSVAHPMEDKHYIEWIVLVEDENKCQRKMLKPGDAPEAIFNSDADSAYARAYCNLHGVWRNK